jgi:hypothetical protein
MTKPRFDPSRRGVLAGAVGLSLTGALYAAIAEPQQPPKESQSDEHHDEQ